MSDEGSSVFARLTRVYRKRDRVRAWISIVYLHDDSEVPEGMLGTVEEANVGGMPIARIRWDHGVCNETSIDSIEPVPS